MPLVMIAHPKDTYGAEHSIQPMAGEAKSSPASPWRPGSLCRLRSVTRGPSIVANVLRCVSSRRIRQSSQLLRPALEPRPYKCDGAVDVVDLMKSNRGDSEQRAADSGEPSQQTPVACSHGGQGRQRDPDRYQHRARQRSAQQTDGKQRGIQSLAHPDVEHIGQTATGVDQAGPRKRPPKCRCTTGCQAPGLQVSSTSARGRCEIRVAAA